MRTAPDGSICPRRNAFRPDLADARLEGVVSAQRFAEGRRAVCAAPTAPFRDRPDIDEEFSASLILGEPVLIFEEKDGWAWAQSERDGYVGYVRADALGPRGPSAPTHRVKVARAHFYPKADLKTPPLGWAPLGGLVTLTGRVEGRFAETAEGGWITASHVAAADAFEEDWAAVAERLLGAPYLWGGETVEGVDCSGMVQIALEQCGRPCPRDSYMQAAELGELLAPDAPLRRGDLVFWKGHVGMMLDAETMLHANAGAMLCARENLAAAIRRIENGGDGPVTARRRVA